MYVHRGCCLPGIGTELSLALSLAFTSLIIWAVFFPESLFMLVVACMGPAGAALTYMTCDGRCLIVAAFAYIPAIPVGMFLSTTTVSVTAWAP